MLAQSMTPVFVAAESVLFALRLLLRRLPSVSRLMSTGAPARQRTHASAGQMTTSMHCTRWRGRHATMLAACCDNLDQVCHKGRCRTRSIHLTQAHRLAGHAAKLARSFCRWYLRRAA